MPRIHVRLGEGHSLSEQIRDRRNHARTIAGSGEIASIRSSILTGHKHDGVFAPHSNGIGDYLEAVGDDGPHQRGNDVDISRLIMMHDNDRWAHLPLVKKIEGFRIVKAS